MCVGYLKLIYIPTLFDFSFYLLFVFRSLAILICVYTKITFHRKQKKCINVITNKIEAIELCNSVMHILNTSEYLLLHVHY